MPTCRHTEKAITMIFCTHLMCRHAKCQQELQVFTERLQYETTVRESGQYSTLIPTPKQ